MPPQSAGPALRRVGECPSLAVPDTPGIARRMTCDRPVTGNTSLGTAGRPLAFPNKEETMERLRATTLDAADGKARYE
jgi:hypothetical protein